MNRILNRASTIKMHVNSMLLRKFLLAGILNFLAIVSVSGQLSRDRVRDAVREAIGNSSTAAAQRSLESHRNNRCASGRVFVIEVLGSGSLIMTSFYCENERAEYNDVLNSLNGKNPNLVLRPSVIDNSTGGGASNRQSAEEIEAERQRQAEIERQKEIERQEEQRKFERKKQELASDLIGMSQEITKPLELIAGEQKSTNSLELIGMEKGTNTNTSLALIDINSTGAKTPVTVSPGQWTMAPDQLQRELTMSRTAFELAMQQMNNYDKNKSALEQGIADLTVKNKNTEHLAFEYEKYIAILEYQQHLVFEFANQQSNTPQWAKEYRINRENTLRNKFGLSEKNLIDLQQEALDVLKGGVPTLGLTFGLEKDDEFMQNKDLKETGKDRKVLDAVEKGKTIGESNATGMMEMAFSNPKIEAMESLSNLKERMNANNRLIESKKTELNGLTVEHDRLQKVFQKYGNDVLSKDEAIIIRFGNECRAALNIKIEEQY